MGAIAHAIKKVVDGVSHAVEAVGHAVEGAVHVVKGVVTCNPSEIMSGLKEMKESGKELITAAGEVASGALQSVINMTPMGYAVNQLTKGALDGFLEGAVSGITGTITRGIDGIEGLADGVIHGDLKKIASSALAVGELALLVAPVGVAANLGKAALKTVVKDVVKDAFTDQAVNTVAGGAANLANQAGVPVPAFAAVAGGAAFAGAAAGSGSLGGKHHHRPPHAKMDTEQPHTKPFESAGGAHIPTPAFGRISIDDLTTANRKEIAASLSQKFSASDLKELKSDLSDFFNHGNDAKRQEINAKWGAALGTDFNDSDVNKKLFFAAKDCA